MQKPPKAICLLSDTYETLPNLQKVTKHIEIKNVYTSRYNFFFLNRSWTTQEGSQGLWHYPQPTLDAPRELKQPQKPSKYRVLLKTYEKQPKLSKSSQKIEKSPKDDWHMDCKCKKVIFLSEG